MSTQVKTLLAELGFKPNEIKVYLGLTALGEAPASKVAKKIDLPRTTVISILEKLEQENFLTAHRYRGTTHYWVESPQTLAQIFENKTKIAGELKNLLTDLYHAEADFPFAKVYDSKSAIRGFIEKTLAKLPLKTTIYTIDRPGTGNYEKIFSNDIGKTLIQLKNKRQVTTKTLVQNGTLKEINPDKLKNQNIIIREMPIAVDFQASLWIIGDTLVLFSGQPPFIIESHHRIITASLKSVFDYLWKISEKPHEI